MSNNLCILPPKCQASDMVKGGQCNPTEIKLQKRYVYNDIPENKRGSSNNKCVAPDPTGMNILEDANFVYKKLLLSDSDIFNGKLTLKYNGALILSFKIFLIISTL